MSRDVSIPAQTGTVPGYRSFVNPTLVSALFEHLDRSGVVYAILHGSEDVPDRVCSDIDMVLDAASFATFGGILRSYARENAGAVCQVIRHEPTACYWVVVFRGAGGAMTEYLKVDVSTDFRRDGRVLFTGSELLSDRELRSGVWSVSTGVEFAAYLAKCVLKRRLEAEQSASLRGLWGRDAAACLRGLSPLLAERDLATVKAAMEDPEDAAMTARLLPLRQAILAGAFRRHPGSAIIYPMRHGLRAIARVLRRTGIQVAVLGPDGVGKSTVVERAVAALVPAFRSSSRLHLRPGLLPPKGGEPQAATPPIPYQRAPYGGLISVLKLGYLAFDYVVGYWILVWPRLVRSTLVVCDRYYLDVVADPARYRYGGPRPLPRWLARVTPGPDLYLVFDAPADVIQSRKSEVPPETTEGQLTSYRELVSRYPNTVRIDASGEVDVVVDQVVGSVLGVMVAQAARR